MLDLSRIILGREGVRALIVALRSRNSALRAENSDLRQLLGETRAAMRELQAAVQARWDAERRYLRERAMNRAWAAERDPSVPLR